MVKYRVDIIWLPKDLLYKDIPLTMYFNNEQIMEGGQVYIASDYKGVYLKDFLCTVEGIYVLIVPHKII
jgi:hypothetical protein